MSQGNITLALFLGFFAFVTLVEEVVRAVIMRGRDKRKALVAAPGSDGRAPARDPDIRPQ